MINAFSMKLWWNFRSNASLWAKFMLAKYGRNKHPIDCQRSATGSSTWNRLMGIKEAAEENIFWILGDGNINFWKDKWLIQGRLCDFVSPPQHLAGLSVKDALINIHEWWPQFFLSTGILQDILSTASNIRDSSDQCVWTVNSDGNFTISSAWWVRRQKRNLMRYGTMLWHHLIPLKWSILVWKAVNGKLPLDFNLQQIGIQLASKCECCVDSKVESIDHLFVQSETAQKMWQYFEARLSISRRSLLLKLKLNEWWLSKIYSPCHKVALSLIPIGICWGTLV